ncbi:hypothetical protein [Viscerimonas tarda]
MRECEYCRGAINRALILHMPAGANMSEPLIVADFIDLHDNRRGEISFTRRRERAFLPRTGCFCLAWDDTSFADKPKKVLWFFFMQFPLKIKSASRFSNLSYLCKNIMRPATTNDKAANFITFHFCIHGFDESLPFICQKRTSVSLSHFL